MSSGEARHGRRDNGLVAAEYAAVANVDPRVGEHLLDVLGLDGIAAYLRPSTDLNPVTRSSSLPGRPTDRLYVDRAHLTEARDYVRRLAEEGDAADDGEPARASSDDAIDMDAAWAEIVAGFDLTAEAPERIAPDRPGQSSREREKDPRERDRTQADDILPTQTVSGPTGPTGPAGPTAAADPTALRPSQDGTELWDPRDRRDTQRPSWIRLPTPSATPRSADPEEPSLLDGLDSFGAGLEEDDEGYTPPEAPPIPRPSMPSVLAVIGIVGGLIVFLQPGLLDFMLQERVAMLLGFTAVVSGFGTLVWRLRPGDDDDEPDTDHGARV